MNIGQEIEGTSEISKPEQTFRHRPTLWIVVTLAICILIGSVGYDIVDDRAVFVHNEQDRLHTQAKVIENNLESQIKSVAAVLHTIAQKPDFPGMNQRLIDLTNAMPGFRTLVVLDKDGTITSTNLLPYLQQNFSRRDYFSAPLKQGDLSTLYVSPPYKSVLNQFVITLSVIIPGKDGRFNGVAAASLNPDYFNVLLKSVLYDRSMWSSIIHGDGLLFMMNPENQGSPGTNLAVPGTFFSKHVQSGKNANVFIGSSYLAGHQRIIALRTFNPPQLHLSKPLVIAVSRDMDSVLVDWQRDTYLKGLSVILLSGFLLLGTYLVQGRQKKLDRHAHLLFSERITARNEINRSQELQKSYDRLELMQEVAQYHATNVQELLDFSLEKVINLTDSHIGYIYHYSEVTQQFVLNTWSKDVMEACRVAEPQSLYQLEKTGLWGEVVRQRKAIVENDFDADNPLKKGYPEGHVRLSRFLSIPIFDGDAIVAVVGVANKILPYDQTDVLQLTLMMEGVWKIATRLKLEEQISQAGREWQSTFDSINDSIALIDPGQLVVRCNRATGQFLGLEFSDILGHPCWKLFHNADAPIHDCPMSRAVISLHSETSTIKHQDRWLEVTVDPIVSAQGEMTGAVHLVRDVTERVNLTNSIQEVNDLFTLFMQFSPIYTFIKEVSDTESRVLQASDNFWDMIGIKSQDMIGKTMHQLFSKEFADKITADDQQVVASKHVHRLEESLNDGTYITYKFPIVRADGKRILAGYTIDITEQRKLEEALQNKASVMQGVLESTNSAVFSLNSVLCYTSFNAAHVAVMKALYNADIQLEASLLSYLPAEDAAVARLNLERTLAGESFTVEAELGEAGCKRTFFEINHNPIKNAKGIVEGVAVYSNDISERRQAEQEFREMQAQMMQNDKLATIGQLAAGVAHEINNPMGFVGSNMATLAKYIEKYNRYIDLIESQLRDSSSGALPEHIQAARQSLKMEYVMRDISVLVNESNEGIDRVKRIVQDLRTFSRADSSGVGAANLNSCMDSTINIVINEIKYFAELCREYGDLPKVHCNAQQINQIFMNLLMNATHAIQAKGDEVGKIVIRSWCDQENVFVSVSDNGCGIPPENQKKIFDAFFTTKEIGKGTGLGLSISSGIIRKHGGEITLTSDVGVGSTFTVKLPIKQVLDVDGGRQ